MDLLRQNFWLFIVLGIIFISMLLGLLFFFINKCISARAEQFLVDSQQSANREFYADSQYHPKQLVEDLPPLPARNLPSPSCSTAVSYEDVASLPDYENAEEKTPPPPYQSAAAQALEEACPDRCSVSTEAYDDVVLPSDESEDYDDVE